MSFSEDGGPPPATRGDEFLRLFARLESYLRGVLRRPASVSYKDLLEEARRRRRITEDQELQLRSFGYLRNALAHWDSEGGLAIADPRPQALEDFRELVGIVSQPASVIEVLKQGEVHSFGEDDRLDDFLKLIADYDFDQAPVRRRDGSFSVITVRMVVRWLSTKQASREWDFRRVQLNVVLPYFDAAQDRLVEMRFDATVPEVLGQFSPDRDLPATCVFIRAQGMNAIVGIAVASDIPILQRAIAPRK